MEHGGFNKKPVAETVAFVGIVWHYDTYRICQVHLCLVTSQLRLWAETDNRICWRLVFDLEQCMPWHIQDFRSHRTCQWSGWLWFAVQSV